jgi:hypothetical protein
MTDCRDRRVPQLGQAFRCQAPCAECGNKRIYGARIFEAPDRPDQVPIVGPLSFGHHLWIPSKPGIFPPQEVDQGYDDPLSFRGPRL